VNIGISGYELSSLGILSNLSFVIHRRKVVIQAVGFIIIREDLFFVSFKRWDTNRFSTLRFNEPVKTTTVFLQVTNDFIQVSTLSLFS